MGIPFWKQLRRSYTREDDSSDGCYDPRGFSERSTDRRSSRKDSPVTYHLGHGEYDGVLDGVAPSRVRRHINGGEKVEDMRATAPTRLNLAHVRP